MGKGDNEESNRSFDFTIESFSVSERYIHNKYNITPQSVGKDWGGITEECEKLKEESPSVDQQTTSKVGEQVDIREDIVENFAHFPDLPQFQPGKSVDYDHIFDPSNATLESIRQAIIDHPDIDLCDERNSTLDATIDYLEKMANHPYFPVNLQDPSPQQFNRYLAACQKFGDTHKLRKGLQEIGINGRNHRIKAWHRYLVILGVDKLWPVPEMKDPRTRKKHVRIFLPEEVNRWFINGDHVRKRDMRSFKRLPVRKRDVRRYIQYVFWFGFITGLAPEKEYVVLNIDDLYFDIKGCAHINVVRPKVGYKKRTLHFGYTESSSLNHKSFKNFLKVREKFARKDEKALLVNPFTGERWKKADLASQLAKYGKRIDPNFEPYWMRYWSGTQRLIDLGETDKALAKVAVWMGHTLKNKDQTVRYTEYALSVEDKEGNWFNRAFTQHFPRKKRKRRKVGRKHGSLLTQQTEKNDIVVSKPSLKPLDTSAGPWDSLLENDTTNTKIGGCRVIRRRAITLSFFSFYFGGDEPKKNMNKIRQFYIFMISPISLLDGTSKMVRKEAKKTVMSTWLTKQLTTGRFSGKNRTRQSSGEERGESI